MSSSTDTPAASETPAEATPAPPPSALRWWVVAAAISLVIGPLLGSGLHFERARWRIAAGLEHWLDGDLPAALAALDGAAELAPDYPRVFELRSQWRIYAGDYAGALEDAQRLRQLAPESTDGFRLQADALVHLDRAEEAAEVWADYAAKEKEALGAVSPVTLNGVAYFRALANRDLPTALEEVNRAIQALGPDPALLDTRGYIHYLQKDYAAALADLNPAVRAAETQREQARTKEKSLVGLSVKDPRAAAWEEKLLDRNVAVIRYHRGLLLQAMGRDAAAEKDFRRVRELGAEPGRQLF